MISITNCTLLCCLIHSQFSLILKLNKGHGFGWTYCKSRGGTPYDVLHGEAPPERGIFFRLQGYERVGSSLGKSVIWVFERAQSRAEQMEFMAL